MSDFSKGIDGVEDALDLLSEQALELPNLESDSVFNKEVKRIADAIGLLSVKLFELSDVESDRNLNLLSKNNLDKKAIAGLKCATAILSHRNEIDNKMKLVLVELKKMDGSGE